MFHATNFAGAELLPSATLRHASGAHPLRIEQFGGHGISGCSDAPLLVGEAVALELPGLGAVEARVLTAGRRHFTAEWSGSSALRLRFLAGWRDPAARLAA